MDRAEQPEGGQDDRGGGHVDPFVGGQQGDRGQDGHEDRGVGPDAGRAASGPQPMTRQPGGDGGEPRPQRVDGVGAHDGLPGARGRLQRPEDVAADEHDSAGHEQHPDGARAPSRHDGADERDREQDAVGERIRGEDHLRRAAQLALVGGQLRQDERRDHGAADEQDHQRRRRQARCPSAAATGARTPRRSAACTGRPRARARRRGRARRRRSRAGRPAPARSSRASRASGRSRVRPRPGGPRARGRRAPRRERWEG